MKLPLPVRPSYLVIGMNILDVLHIARENCVPIIHNIGDISKEITF